MRLGQVRRVNLPDVELCCVRVAELQGAIAARFVERMPIRAKQVEA